MKNVRRYIIVIAGLLFLSSYVKYHRQEPKRDFIKVDLYNIVQSESIPASGKAFTIIYSQRK